MPFTAQELSNITNALLDYNIKGAALSQSIQEKPLMRRLVAKQQTFPGGKELITWPVKGVYTTQVQGYTHDDTVVYRNPANIKRANAPWFELHAGISCTHTELKKNGISVTDTSGSGRSTSNHTDREMVVLTDLLQDKIEDMMEGWARGFQEICWRDGTQDSKVFPGMLSFILDAPTVGSTFGIDRVANTWWRNRAQLAIDTSTPSNLNLVTALQQQYRQLRRYGGRPNVFLAGSDFMDAFEKELRSKGNYTLEGWAKSGTMDASVADLAFKGVMVEYEPSLDDLSRSKYGYWFDDRRVQLMVMDGEDKKTVTPERPPEKYVIYRAMTWTGMLKCNQLNANLVISIA